jgi:tetratricopeptide (TPR) repeat protein
MFIAPNDRHPRAGVAARLPEVGMAVMLLRRLLVAVGLCAAAVPPCQAQKLKIDVPIGELESRAKRDSNDAVAHYNLALGYWSKRRWDDADASLKRAAALDQRFAPIDLAIAYWPFASGRAGHIEWRPLPGARVYPVFVADDSMMARFDRHYRRAFMLDPLVDIRISVATEWRDVDYVDYYDRALYAYNDGLWEEAYRRFGDLVADSGKYTGWARPIYERILWYHALAAMRLNKPTDAVRDLQRLVQWSQGREQSDTMFHFALRTNEYRYTLGYAQQRAGDVNAAMETYREALGSDLGLFTAHLRIAEIYEGARQWDDAINSRRNAFNANPDDPSLQLDLGWTLAKAGRFDEAETELQQAIERAPRDPRGAYFLGLVQQRLNKPADAKASFQRFVEIAPSRFGRQIADAQQRLETLR